MTDVPAVILAGGRATRMGGGDKALLPLKSATLLDHVLLRLRPQVGDIAINANGDPARFEAFGLPVLPDSVTDHPGPLAGVLAGLDWAAGLGAEAVITVAADTPFFPSDLTERLATLDQPLVLAATRDDSGRLWRHPTFGLWPVALRDDLRSALNDGVRKVVQWTDRHDGRFAEFPDEAAFFNVNTPEDLARAEAMT